MKSISLRIEGGKVPADAFARISGLLTEIKDGEYEVVLKRKVSKRSASQNALYRVWVRIIARETGNSEPDIHDYLRYKFLRSTKLFEGEEVALLPTTTELTVEQMTDYMNNVESFVANELSITLPSSEDYIDYNELY